jgi:hypothetical protein
LHKRIDWDAKYLPELNNTERRAARRVEIFVIRLPAQAPVSAAPSVKTTQAFIVICSSGERQGRCNPANPGKL